MANQRGVKLYEAKGQDNNRTANVQRSTAVTNRIYTLALSGS